MGNSESSALEGGGNTVDDFDGVETLGYRVLGVQPNSPASAAGLVSFFDFLIGADGQMLLGSGEDLQEGEEYDDVDFPALLQKFKGRPLQLLVWNIKCQEQRLVDIIPRDDWDGAGLLGVTIRLDDYAGAEDRLIRILTVEHNSPAAIAGLVCSQDYLLGTTTHSFDSTKVLAAVLDAHVDKVVELYVYNTNSDKVRVVALMPTWSWGGNGLLGAEVGTGYLHRLPGSCRGTLGGSVERRVRWTGGSKNGPTSPQLQQTPTLELEPQLEMEQYEEEEEGYESMGSVSLASQISTPLEEATDETPQPELEPTSHPSAETPTNGLETPVKEKAPSSGGVFIPAPISLQNLPPKELPAQSPAQSPAMSPFSISDPAAQPITVTTFIPGPKPPPLTESISAEDLFSGPPPKARISTTTSVVINPNSLSPANSPSPNYQFRKAPPTTPGAEANGEATFATPHPPIKVNSAMSTAHAAQTPPVPVPAATTTSPFYGTGDNDFMPPPPKMSGAR